MGWLIATAITLAAFGLWIWAAAEARAANREKLEQQSQLRLASLKDAPTPQERLGA